MNNSNEQSIFLDDQPWSIGLSPDRQTALVAGERLHQVNLAAQSIAPIDMEGLDCSGLVAQSPNGNFALVDCERGLLAVFEKNFDLLNIIKHADLKTADHVHLSNDGNKVVTTSLEETLVVWDVGKAAECYRWGENSDIAAPSRHFVALATDYVDDMLVYAEGPQLNFIRLNHQQLDTQELSAELAHSCQSVNQQYALLISKTGESYVLHLPERQLTEFARLPSNEITACAINDDGQIIAIHSANPDNVGGMLLVMNRNTGNMTQLETDASHVDCMRFIDDHTLLYGTDVGLSHLHLVSDDSSKTADTATDTPETAEQPTRKTIVDDALLSDPFDESQYATDDDEKTLDLKTLAIAGAVLFAVVLLIINL